MSTQNEWLTAAEARELLKVSKGKFAELVSSGTLETQASELDKRIKLVRRADVERLAEQPRAKSKKVAA